MKKENRNFKLKNVSERKFKSYLKDFPVVVEILKRINGHLKTNISNISDNFGGITVNTRVQKLTHETLIMYNKKIDIFDKRNAVRKGSTMYIQQNDQFQYHSFCYNHDGPGESFLDIMLRIHQYSPDLNIKIKDDIHKRYYDSLNEIRYVVMHTYVDTHDRTTTGENPDKDIMSIGSPLLSSEHKIIVYKISDTSLSDLVKSYSIGNQWLSTEIASHWETQESISGFNKNLNDFIEKFTFDVWIKGPHDHFRKIGNTFRNQLDIDGYRMNIHADNENIFIITLRNKVDEEAWKLNVSGSLSSGNPNLKKVNFEGRPNYIITELDKFLKSLQKRFFFGYIDKKFVESLELAS